MIPNSVSFLIELYSILDLTVSEGGKTSSK